MNKRLIFMAAPLMFLAALLFMPAISAASWSYEGVVKKVTVKYLEYNPTTEKFDTKTVIVSEPKGFTGFNSGFSTISNFPTLFIGGGLSVNGGAYISFESDMIMIGRTLTGNADFDGAIALDDSVTVIYLNNYVGTGNILRFQGSGTVKAVGKVTNTGQSVGTVGFFVVPGNPEIVHVQDNIADPGGTPTKAMIKVTPMKFEEVLP